MKAKSALWVGANVFVVQKLRKSIKPIVNMKGRSYNNVGKLNDYQSKR